MKIRLVKQAYRSNAAKTRRNICAPGIIEPVHEITNLLFVKAELDLELKYDTRNMCDEN